MSKSENSRREASNPLSRKSAKMPRKVLKAVSAFYFFSSIGGLYSILHIAATIANAAKPVLEALAKREVDERSFKSEAEKIGQDIGDVG